MEAIKIIPENNEEWLAHRKSFIGGSEITTLLGLDEWRSPYDMFLEKTGQAEPFEENKHTLAGKFLEDGVARYWEYETDHKIIKSSDNNILYVHPTHKIGGTPDRRYFINGSSKLTDRAILEVKTTMKIIDYANVPLAFFIQPNLYCGLLGYKTFTLVWFEFFTKELKYVDYDFDEELYEMCCKEADDFWNNHVIPGVPPPIRTEADVLRLFPKEEEGKVIVADDAVLDLYSEAIDYKRDIKKLNSSYKEITEQLKLTMKDAERIVDMNTNTLITWKANKKGSRVFNVKEI